MTANQNKYICCILLIFPFVIPEGFFYLSNTLYTIIYTYFRYLNVFILLCAVVIHIYDNRVLPAHIYLLVGISAYTLLITLYYSKSITAWFNQFGIMIISSFVLELFADDIRIFINSLFGILFFWLVVNFFCMIIYPNGMYVSVTGYSLNWILGYKSSFQYFIIPSICLGWIIASYGSNQLLFYATLALSVYETLHSQNTMLLITLCVFLIVYTLNLTRHTKLFNMRNYALLCIVLNIVFIFYLTMITRNSMGLNMLSALGKGSSLTGRSTVIWPLTIEKIKESPIIGNGVWNSDDRRKMYLNIPGDIHAHNQLLEIVFIGGICLLVLYILFIYYLHLKTRRLMNTMAARILCFNCFLVHIMVIVEVYLRVLAFPLWICLFLCFYILEIEYNFCKAEQETI